MLHLKDQSIRTILGVCPVGILLSDPQGNILFCNTKAQKIFDYNEASLCSMTIEQLVPTRFRHEHAHFRHEFAQYPATRHMGEGRQLSGLTSYNEEIPIEIGLAQVELEGNVYSMITIIDRSQADRISELEAMNRQLTQAATHDYLTGLANRRLFIELVEKLMGVAMRHEESLAFVFIDLDGFKQVNDKYGHNIGDLLLVEVANELQRHVRKSDVVSRVGGDEFLLCLNQIECFDDISKVVGNQLSGICNITDVNGCEIQTSASIGVVTVKIDETVSLLEIIAQADCAMYRAKANGKGRIVCTNYEHPQAG